MKKKILKLKRNNVKRKKPTYIVASDFYELKKHLEEKFFSQDSKIKITEDILIKMRIIEIEALCSILNIEIKYTFDEKRVIYYRPPVPPNDDSDDKDENKRKKYLAWETRKKVKYKRAMMLIEHIINAIDNSQETN